jgi:FkbM family methyltransferase
MRSAVIDRGHKLELLELWGSSGRVESYKLRSSDVRIVVRHRTRDVDIVDEVFVGVPCYRPPREVVELLETLPELRVLDLGANIGLFGSYMLSRHPRATITSFEPDPWNFQLLERCVLLNQAQSKWTLIEKCVGVAGGERHLAAGRYADSHVTEGSGIVVACVDVFPYLDNSDLVKMDIEGSEWPILSDPRLAAAKCPAIVVEWHERGAPADDAYATAVSLLRGAGFQTSGERGQDSHGVLWGWRCSPDAPLRP